MGVTLGEPAIAVYLLCLPNNNDMGKKEQETQIFN